jgi:hypothetical protein
MSGGGRLAALFLSHRVCESEIGDAAEASLPNACATVISCF